MLDGAMPLHLPLAFSVLGLSIGWAILVAALLALYVWFCVYWWRGGRPVAGRPEHEEPPRRHAA
jgi:hypothetical protein